VFHVVYEHVFLQDMCDSVIDTSNIPHVVHAKTTTTPVNPFYAQNNDTINSLPMVVGQNNSILPIVVEPIEATTTSDLPIAMEPIEAPTIYHTRGQPGALAPPAR
jgi:hypothetical protein